MLIGGNKILFVLFVKRKFCFVRKGTLIKRGLGVILFFNIFHQSLIERMFSKSSGIS